MLWMFLEFAHVNDLLLLHNLLEFKEMQHS